MKKGRLVLSIFMIVFSICLIGCGVFLLLNQNKIKFVSAIRKATNNIVEDIDWATGIFMPGDLLNVKGDKKINTTNTINYAGKVITFGGDIYSKDGAEDLYSTLAFNFGANPLNLDLVLKDTKIYVKLKDISDKYFSGDVDVPEQSDATFTDEQIVTLKDYFVDSTFEALASNEITSTKVSLLLNSVSYDLEKLEVDVSEKNIQDSMIIFLKKIKNNNELSSIVNKMVSESGYTLSDVIKELEDSSKDMSTDMLLKYSIYLDKDEVIYRHEVVIPATTDSMTGDVTVSIDSYTDKETRSQFMVSIASGDTSYLTFEIKGIDETQSVITGSVLGVPLISGNYTKTDSRISFDLTFTDSMFGTEPQDYKFSYTIDTLTKGKLYNFTLNLDIPGLKFESSNTVDLSATYPDVSLGTTTSFDQLTDEEMNAIMVYLTGVVPPEFLTYLQTSSAI